MALPYIFCIRKETAVYSSIKGRKRARHLSVESANKTPSLSRRHEVFTLHIGPVVGEMDTRRDSSDIKERANATSRRVLERNQETDNPCYKEHLLSLRCLESNQVERNVCEPYFLNYRNCKNFWTSVQNDRKLKGIEPYLPPLEERVKIKADFLNSR